VLRRQADDEEQEAAPFEVFEENWDTAQAFLAMGTQWRIEVVTGGERAIVIHLGLRYEAIPAALVMAGVPHKKRREVYQGLRVMEAAAMKVLNEREDG
jgi:hypothetical protein